MLPKFPKKDGHDQIQEFLNSNSRISKGGDALSPANMTSFAERLEGYVPGPTPAELEGCRQRWSHEPGELVDPEHSTSFYRYGLCHEVSKVATGSSPDIEQLRDQDAKLPRYSGRGALHGSVLVTNNKQALPGSPFVGGNTDSRQLYGYVPTQVDAKWLSGNRKQIVFMRQPWASQVTMNFAAYEHARANGESSSLFPSGSLRKECEYYYTFKGTTYLFAADIDASHITKQHLYEAVRLFRLAFRAALPALGFSQEQADATMEFMGTYESCTAEERASQSLSADSGSRKRSLHLHSHFIGPVAKCFDHYQGWLYHTVLLQIPLQFRTLFDLKVYRNGAFRSLGCCKLPANGARRKWLHPDPIPELSGKKLCELWKGECVASKLWALATAHPAVVHDDVLPGGSLLPGVRFIPEKASVMPTINAQRNWEAGLHWNKIVVEHKGAQLQSIYDEVWGNADLDTETKAALEQRLFKEYVQVAWTRHPDGTLGLALPSELQARWDRPGHGLKKFVMKTLKFDSDQLAVHTEAHYTKFYSGDYNDCVGSTERDARYEADDEFELEELGEAGAVAVAKYGRQDTKRVVNLSKKRKRALQSTEAFPALNSGPASNNARYLIGLTISYGRDRQPSKQEIELLCSAQHFILIAATAVTDPVTDCDPVTVWLREISPREKEYLSKHPAYHAEYKARCSATLPGSLQNFIPESKTPALYAPEIKWLRQRGLLHADSGDITEEVRSALPGELYSNGVIDHSTVRLVRRH